MSEAWLGRTPRLGREWGRIVPLRQTAHEGPAADWEASIGGARAARRQGCDARRGGDAGLGGRSIPTRTWQWRRGDVSDLLVLDIDGEEGRESLRDLEHKHGDLPTTVSQLTGDTLRHVPGLKNAVKFAPGLDIRTDGGYAIVPASRHRSGRCYEWETSSHPADVTVADAPTWLLDLLPKREAGPEVENERAPEVEQPPEVVENARLYLAKVDGAVSGSGGHNRTFRVACVLVHRFESPIEQALVLLREWNEKVPAAVDREGATPQVEDAAKAPRRVPPPPPADLPKPPCVTQIQMRFWRADDAEVAGALLEALCEDQERLVHDEGRIHRYQPPTDSGTTSSCRICARRSSTWPGAQLGRRGSP